MTSFTQFGTLIEKTHTKKSLLLCWLHNKSDVFVLCVLYIRSNLFETRQMGKVVQHRKNILNPFPDLLRGVASHQTQIVTPISMLSKDLEIYLLTKSEKISFEWKKYVFCLLLLQ